MLVEAWARTRAAREMRKHVAWYVKGLPHAARVREQVNRTRDRDELAELLRGYLGELTRRGLGGVRAGPGRAAAGGAACGRLS